MQITLAVSGIAAAIIGSKELVLSLPDGATYNQIIRQLGGTYPALKGVVINPEGNALLNANVLIVNDYVILERMLDDSPRDGDRLMLMAFIVGG